MQLILNLEQMMSYTGLKLKYPQSNIQITTTAVYYRHACALPVYLHTFSIAILWHAALHLILQISYS